MPVRLPIDRKEIGKTGKKQETENLRKAKISGAENEKEPRERRNGDARQSREKAETEQRKNKERTRKEQGNAAHLLADYQPLNQTNKTPKKREVT